MKLGFHSEARLPGIAKYSATIGIPVVSTVAKACGVVFGRTGSTACCCMTLVPIPGACAWTVSGG